MSNARGWHYASLLLALLGLVACKTPDEKALAKYLDKGNARVAALEKLAVAIRGVPPTTTDSLKPGSYRYSVSGIGDNFAFLQAPALEHLSKRTLEPFELPNRFSMFGTNYYLDACSLVKTGKDAAGSPPLMVNNKRGLDALLAVQYVGIVRRQSFSAPTVASDKQFTSGRVAGDVIVFDLESGAQLGAFQFFATNKPDVKVEISKESDDLINDLGREATRAIVLRFAALAPGASIAVPPAKPTASAQP